MALLVIGQGYPAARVHSETKIHVTWRGHLLTATFSCSNCWTIDVTEYLQEYNETILLASMNKRGITLILY